MNYISNPSCPHLCITRDAAGSGGHPISPSTASASWTRKPPQGSQEGARHCQNSGNYPETNMRNTKHTLVIAIYIATCIMESLILTGVLI